MTQGRGATKSAWMMVVTGGCSSRMSRKQKCYRWSAVPAPLLVLMRCARGLCPVLRQLCLPGAALWCDLGVIPVDITFSPPRNSESFLIAFNNSLFGLNWVKWFCLQQKSTNHIPFLRDSLAASNRNLLLLFDATSYLKVKVIQWQHSYFYKYIVSLYFVPSILLGALHTDTSFTNYQFYQ